MVQPPEPVSDAFQHALAEERLRSTRNLNLFRFQGLTIFLVLAVLLHVCLPFQPIGPSLTLFACNCSPRPVWPRTVMFCRLAGDAGAAGVSSGPGPGAV